MNVIIRRLPNNSGAVLTADVGRKTNVREKIQIEERLVQYAFDQLFPGEGLNIYREYHSDLPSITVIRNLNDLPQDTDTIEL